MASTFTFGFSGDDIDADGDADADVDDPVQIDVSVSGQHETGEAELLPPQKHTFAELVSIYCSAHC